MTQEQKKVVSNLLKVAQKQRRDIRDVLEYIRDAYKDDNINAELDRVYNDKINKENYA